MVSGAAPRLWTLLTAWGSRTLLALRGLLSILWAGQSGQQAKAGQFSYFFLETKFP